MSLSAGFEFLSGREWQQLCVRVLFEHHGPGELIEMPDQDRGDGGLEAFSTNGCAYQCYGPDNEPLENAVRLRKHRAKMRKDVGKFIENESKLKRIIPAGLKIRRWILLVPKLTSKDLNETACEQTQRIRAAQLPYAHGEIMVVAHTLDAYESACQAVVSRKLKVLDIPQPAPVSLSTVEDPRIERMSEKLGRTRMYSDDDRRFKLMDRLLENSIVGRDLRNWVQDYYSELGDDLRDKLEDLENRLEVQYALQEPDPNKLFATVLRDSEALVTQALNTRPSQSRIIAEGQVAEWLMNCPLDFV